jgi:predicted GNAT superfamily acetyltransferase
VEVRPVREIGEYRACEALQRQAWLMDDDLEVVPLHLLVGVHKGGGLLLGAFDGDEVVGFVFGFPGLTPEGKLKHCSHMMGVLPERQSQGIGWQLKLAQREAVQAQGLDLITWTYDPLESRNAYLNISKLGAVCGTYVRDLYGPLADGLNAGLPTDRLQVDWWVRTDWVAQHVGGEAVEERPCQVGEANVTGRTPQGLRTPGSLHIDLDLPTIQVEVPGDYRTLKSADSDLARDWRAATRTLFEAYFSAGYVACDYRSQRIAGERRNYYLLRKPAPVP